MARGAGANNNDNNASVDISDDDDGVFLPGPVPVFRLEKGNTAGEMESLLNQSKRKMRAADHPFG